MTCKSHLTRPFFPDLETVEKTVEKNVEKKPSNLSDVPKLKKIAVGVRAPHRMKYSGLYIIYTLEIVGGLPAAGGNISTF